MSTSQRPEATHALLARDPEDLGWHGHTLDALGNFIEFGEWVTLDEALEWGRARVTCVRLQYAWSYHSTFSAGTETWEGLPVWPPDPEVRQALDEEVVRVLAAPPRVANAWVEAELIEIVGEWTLAWGDEHRPIIVTDADQFAQLLTQATEDAVISQTMVELVSPAGDSCAIGLGRSHSVVTFTASGEDPPYYVSRGTESSDAPLAFFYNGHWTEFGPHAAIPVAAALAAVTEFYEKGDRPSIDWDEA